MSFRCVVLGPSAIATMVVALLPASAWGQATTSTRNETILYTESRLSCSGDVIAYEGDRHFVPAAALTSSPTTTSRGRVARAAAVFPTEWWAQHSMTDTRRTSGKGARTRRRRPSEPLTSLARGRKTTPARTSCNTSQSTPTGSGRRTSATPTAAAWASAPGRRPQLSSRAAVHSRL
jgi:hypothetical protein